MDSNLILKKRLRNQTCFNCERRFLSAHPDRFCGLKLNKPTENVCEDWQGPVYPSSLLSEIKPVFPMKEPSNQIYYFNHKKAYVPASPFSEGPYT